MADFITISKIEDGTRLLRWFLRQFPSMPQREFYKLCRGGQIRVNSKRVKGQEILRTGDAVRVPPTLATYANTGPNKTESGEHFSLSDLEELRKCIIHDDQDVVVFNKPAGLAVQGGQVFASLLIKWRRHYSRMIKSHWCIGWIGKPVEF